MKTEIDGTSAETRFGLPAKRTSPFISAGVSVQSCTDFLGMRVKLKTAGYPLHSPLSPSLLLPCVAVCHQIPFPLYMKNWVMMPNNIMYKVVRSSGVPRIFFRGGGSTNSVEDRGQRERGSKGSSSLVGGSGGSCNLVQEIAFHIVNFS